jgi:transcriptional regulatory protein RtcR
VDLAAPLDADTLGGIDRFDRLQLESVVRACRATTTLSAAGRRLHDRSREQRSVSTMRTDCANIC